MLGCYGNVKIKTPNLDKLAKQGVVFDSAYTPCPLCVPARASLATGNYASSHGYYDNALAYNGEVKSWATVLEEKGIHTTTIGKLHYKSDTPKTGFLDQRIPLHIKDGVGDIYGAIRDKEITRPQFRKALYDAHEGESDYIRYDREVAKRAIEYLNCESNKPFALMVSFVSPHFPLVAPPEFASLYNIDDIEVPKGFSKSDWVHHPVLDDYRRYCCQEDVPEDVRKEAIRIYYGMCSFLDHQIGLVLEALKNSGHDQDTIVIYVSDHGDMMGEHGLFFKSCLYEGSAGIPMLMAGPDIEANKRINTPTSLIDIYPTILEAFGIEQTSYDKSLPGKSLFDVIANPNDDRSVISEYLSFGCYTSLFMIRKKNFKYVHYVGERPQLFDLEKDPNECFDLFDNPNYHQIVCDLEEELRLEINIEKVDFESRKAEEQLLIDRGGKEEFLKTFKPSLFSPIPKNL